MPSSQSIVEGRISTSSRTTGTIRIVQREPLPLPSVPSEMLPLTYQLAIDIVRIPIVVANTLVPTDYRQAKELMNPFTICSCLFLTYDHLGNKTFLDLCPYVLNSCGIDHQVSLLRYPMLH